MKRILINRGKSPKPIILDNGDKYDSVLKLIEDNESVLFHSDFVNTDHTNGYKGGILKEGSYYGILGTRSTGMKVVKLFSRNADINHIKTANDIAVADYVLPSKVSNPNHNGKKIMSYIQIHGGGLSWDYSHGCITLPNYSGYNEFDKLIKLLDMNEIVLVELK
jgi:hypothetical protein